jgi:ribose/xylose/arabinose/galactoside ABC-type transport system permease subunit
MPLSLRMPAARPRLLWPLAALALLLAYDGAFTEHFFRVRLGQDGRLFGTPVDVLHHASSLVLLALGMTLVIATGGVDLSVGATMAIAGTVAAVWVRDHGGGATLGCGLAVLAGAACGAWNGLLVAVVDVPPIVATLILMRAGRGVAELLGSNQTVTLTGTPLGWLSHVPAWPGTGVAHWLYARLAYPVPLDVVWAVAAIVAIAWLTRRTALGLFLEAVGNNPLASRYAGVNARMVTFAAYLACGATAGFAGLLETADLNASPIGLGDSRELDAILAVTLGGTALAGGRFSLAGAVIGALTIVTLNQTIQLAHVRGRQIPNMWFQVVEAIAIMGVCLLQSAKFRGLLGRAARVPRWGTRAVDG